MFYLSMCTWTVTDELRLSIRLGLKKGLALVHGMRRALTDDQQDRIADEVAAQLRRGWIIERRDVPIGAGLHSRTGKKEPDKTA